VGEIPKKCLEKCKAHGLDVRGLRHFQEIERGLKPKLVLVLNAQGVTMLVCTTDSAQQLGLPIPQREITYQGAWDKIRRNRLWPLIQGCRFTPGVNNLTCGDVSWDQVVILPLDHLSV
jgi:hypothetical protein